MITDKHTLDRIARTVALVEATNFEHLMLWAQYAEDGNLQERDSYRRDVRMSWVQDLSGWHEQVGFCCNVAAIHVSMSWATVDGHLMCFWESTSTIVDYDIVKKWLLQTFPKNVRTTDAQNFHNAFP